ncbi:MAG: hypothetical protein VR64_18355 [Desulfatitalea sp. BRH_c12]|nr:MAG: hypothetical protein VR64_18355 [Desulfatitalea sp. BRH_c12]
MFRPLHRRPTAHRFKTRFSPAEWTGLAAILLATLLGLFSAWLATLPLFIFLLLCAIAPLLPNFGFFLPIISKGRSDSPTVALTFDDGPDPVTTPLLLALLAKYQAPATFFVTGQRARQYPQLIRDILACGHTIGNHSYHHDNFLMLRSHRRLVLEIETAQQIFRQIGVFPLAFRPPVGITNSRLPRALAQTGMYLVNFSNRARDCGNRRVDHLSRKILRQLRNGDIILLHDIKPPDDALLGRWHTEVDLILAGIRQRGLTVLPLAALIGRPVMK